MIFDNGIEKLDFERRKKARIERALFLKIYL